MHYTFGAEFYLSDTDELHRIYEVYLAEFQKIEEATFFSENSFLIEESPEKSDARVKEACKAAEEACSKKGCDVISGYIIFKVTATYFSNDESKVIYSKEFGKLTSTDKK